MKVIRMKKNNTKGVLNLLLIAIVFYAQPSHAWWFSVSSESTVADSAPINEQAHNEWLKKRFSEQHQQLIPIVAVADMFFTCNQTRKTDKSNYKLSYLINDMDKAILAEKLSICLGDDLVKSDVALNFGLYGCFHAQLAHLSKPDREQKMLLVKQAVSALSHAERQKSFTQCVTEQSIHYLK